MATAVTADTLIDAIVTEMSEGIECAINFWMSQIDSALRDPRLTTLGRMNAVQEIVKRYRTSSEFRVDHDGHAA